MRTVACVLFMTYVALTWSAVCAKERYHTTAVTTRSGISLETLGSLKYWAREYKLITFISFKNLEREFNLIVDIKQKTEQLCARRSNRRKIFFLFRFNFVKESSVCAVHMYELTKYLERVAEEKARLFSMTAYRPKSGPVNLRSSGITVLTGNIDAYEGKRYNHEISKLLGEIDGLVDFVNDRTSVVIDSIRTFNRTLCILNKNEKALSNDLENLSKLLDFESQNKLNDIDRILDDISNFLTHLTNDLQREIKNLIEAVKFAHAGKMHPLVLSPSGLLDSLRDAEHRIPQGFRLPLPLDSENADMYAQIINITVFFCQDKLIFLISLPLKSGHDIKLDAFRVVEEDMDKKSDSHEATISTWTYIYLLSTFALIVIVLIIYKVLIKKKKNKTIRRKLYYKNEKEKLETNSKKSPTENSPHKNSPQKKSSYKKSLLKCDKQLKKKLMDKERMASIRTDPEYRERENVRRRGRHQEERKSETVRMRENLRRIQLLRLKRRSKEFKLRENLGRRERHQEERKNETVRMRENLRRIQLLRLKRRSKEFKLRENLGRRERHQEERKNETVRMRENLRRIQLLRLKRRSKEFKLRENLGRRERHQEERKNKIVRDRENLGRRGRHQEERKSETVRMRENLRRIQLLRLKRRSKEFKLRENLGRRERHQEERKNKIVRDRENLGRRRRHQEERKNKIVRDRENLGRRRRHQEERKIEFVRRQENLRRKIRHELERQSLLVRMRENILRKLRHQADRENKEMRDAENKMRKKRHDNDKSDSAKMTTKREKKRASMSALRDDDKYRSLEKVVDKASKRAVRLNTEYTFRKNYESELLSKKDNGDKYAKAQLQYLDSIKEGPNWICTCCEGLWFSRSVVQFDKFKLESLLEDSFEKKELLHSFVDKIINYPSDYVCKTCMNSIKKRSIPKMATSWGMKFPIVPDCVANLSKLEERMVTPFINFMQIRPLKRFALNPQLQMKGSVVNIMVEMGDMLQVLPRRFDEMATIQVKLKRHIDHKSDYKFETIRPALICKALNYLVNTPLYKKYEIKVNEEYFQRFRDKEEEFLVSFIVDAKDDVDDDEGNVDNLRDATDDEHREKKNVDENEEVESDPDDYFNDDDEVLLTDANKEVVEGNCSIKIIAPGQDKSPIAWHKFSHLDELSFPRKFAGQPLSTHEKLSYSDRAKSEARRKDRRCCSPERILYMAKLKQEKAVSSSLNICMRKSKAESSNVLTAKKVLNKEFINEAIANDAGFRVLNNIRSAPSYWEKRKGELLSMVRQLGHPTFFFTVSAAESSWIELLRSLYLAKYDLRLTDTQLLELDPFSKTQLIRDDPVTCARYFDFKVSSLMKLLKSPDGPFGENYVQDCYQKVEFQQRGSPHEHMFLWCRNAPVYNKSSNEECIAFIDKHVTCKYDETFPLLSMQRHVHTHTCYKGNKHKKVCRFHYPIPVMPRTMILEPLEEGQRTDKIKENSKAIKNKMYGFYMKSTDVSFETILNELDMSEEDYVLAIRSQIDKTRVFLKRDSLSVAINSYNKTLLTLFNSNIDIQYVLDPYSCASYMVNYITKIEAGLSKLLRTAAADANVKGLGIRDKLRKIANVFLNANLMSAQEGAYNVMGFPLSKCSRACIFVNTCPRDERIRMLKAPKDLAALPEDCNEVFLPNITERYAARERAREKECLADFATAYRPKKSKAVSLDGEAELNEDEQDEDEGDMVPENPERRKILRYRHYKISQDEYNFYREQILLFHPWRDEDAEVEKKNCETLYKENIETIKKNSKKYNVISEEEMEKALEIAQENETERDEAEYEDVMADKIPSGMEVDIDEQAGKPKGGSTSNKKSINMRIVTPAKNEWEETLKTLRMLNNGQREIVMHVFSEIKKESKPLRLFISGAAGVGKSVVISVLFQLLTYYYEKRPGVKTDTPKVLLTAPSGKAAHLIGGVTLHTAFSLPVTKYGGKMPALSEDVANSLRCRLIDLKLLIIDEISMVGSKTLARVDTRLRQVMGKTVTFGGVSVIVVGDLHQLPPVMDKPVFQSPNLNEFSGFLAVNPLWEEFSLYELTEIMRQKGEKEFILVLNKIARNIEMNDDELAVLKSRIVSPSSVPESVLRLHSKNKLVDDYNDLRIKSHRGEQYESLAEDVIIGKNLSKKQESRIRMTTKNRQLCDLLGLPNKVIFKIGIKYMITYNLEVDQGLVNGACGTLRHVTVVGDKVQAVWIEFPESRIGMNRKIKYADFMKENNIPNNLVRIDRLNSPLSTNPNEVFQIFRKQFPLVPAEALTVHKSQGQSYEEICLDLKSIIGPNRRQLLYVALSRVKSLKGLFILGTIEKQWFTSGHGVSKDIVEIERLRSDRRVTLSYDNLKEKHGLTIIYHNVNSLRKSVNDIERDCWYSRGDVIIFAETLHKETPRSLTIGNVNFTTFHASERVTKKHERGLLLLAKPNVEMEIKILKVISTSEKNNTNGVELVLFSVSQCYVITGYKNPSCTNSLFFSSLKELIMEVNLDSKVVVLGDFNFDLMKPNPLEIQLEKYTLKSALSKEIATTNFNTQIDVILSNFRSSAGVYDSYFSDHKPVFINVTSYLNRNVEVRDANVEDVKPFVDNEKVRKNPSMKPVDVNNVKHFFENEKVPKKPNLKDTDVENVEQQARKVDEMNIKIDEYDFSANTPVLSFSEGHYNIYKHDLVSLKTIVSPEEKQIITLKFPQFRPRWLTDNIIDCYLYCLSQRCPHFTFGDTTLCQFLGAVQPDRGLLARYCSNLPIWDKTHLALPINCDGRHWVVAHIRLDEKTYTILDPMSGTFTRELLEHRVKLFLSPERSLKRGVRENEEYYTCLVSLFSVIPFFH